LNAGVLPCGETRKRPLRVETPRAFEFDAIDIGVRGIGGDRVVAARGNGHAGDEVVHIGVEDRAGEGCLIGVVAQAEFVGEKFLGANVGGAERIVAGAGGQVAGQVIEIRRAEGLGNSAEQAPFRMDPVKPAQRTDQRVPLGRLVFLKLAHGIIKAAERGFGMGVAGPGGDFQGFVGFPDILSEGTEEIVFGIIRHGQAFAKLGAGEIVAVT